MDIYNFDSNLDGGKQISKQTFLGEGAYGCTYTPGLNCDGKTNKSKYSVNKIQEINFLSKNEVEISQSVKKIKGYKSRFVPINKSCIVNFNKIVNSKDIVSNCDLFDNYSNTDTINFINKQYFMFYMKRINGLTIKSASTIINTNYQFHDFFYHALYYLLNSIYLLNRNKIIHNDLHTDNIIYDDFAKIPYIIDFGLSYKHKNLFKNTNLSKAFDYPRIKNFFF